MKPFSHILTKFCLIQMLLVILGFMITRAFLKARVKALDPDSLRLLPLHWLPDFVGSYGPGLLLIPLIWCAAVLWLGRHDLTHLHYGPTVFRIGMASTLALAAVCTYSVVLAFKAPFGPVAQL